jgi:hypothetical protein
MEFARSQHLNMWCMAPSSRQCSHPHIPENQSVTSNNMVIVPHPPYSPDLAPCDFALFPKLNMTLKGRRFETVSDIQRESQEVLDSIQENDFHGFWSVEKTMESLYTFPRRLLWRRWQPKLMKLWQHFFFDPARELSNITSCADD